MRPCRRGDPSVLEIRVQILDSGLPAPDRAYATDAGLDLRARVDVTLSSAIGEAVVPTGIAVEIPPEHVGLVCPRSGLAAQGVSVLNGPGIIDEDYRGELQVILFSVRPVARTLRRGDRIAQLLVLPLARPQVSVVEHLSESARGARGLGSSGVDDS
jgi:dUTP pyrophosphatase